MSRAGREALDALLERRDLTEDAAYDLMVSLTDPAMAPAMTGALLAALRIKGATAAEVRGFARAMRSLARRPGIPADAPVADVVGTVEDRVEMEADSHDCLATSEERPSTARTITPRFAVPRACSSREGISASDIGRL